MAANKPNPDTNMLIPYLQRRAGRALATVLELELELARARVACDHAVMALKEGRARMVRQGKVPK